MQIPSCFAFSKSYSNLMLSFKKTTLTLLISLTLILPQLTPMPAQAIVNAKGQLDGKQYPWIGSLWTTEDSFQGEICTVILIDKSWVLTAAHCIDPKKYFQITLGSNSVNDGKYLTIDRFLIHEKYDKNTLENDIALLHLKNPVNYYHTNLPPANDTKLINAGMYAIGFGQKEDGNTDGFLYYTPQVSFQSIGNKIFGLSDKIIYANYKVVGKDSYSSICHGDSGGPLVAKSNNSTLLGISSFGPKTCGLKTPSGFVRVSKYLSWITQAKESILRNSVAKYNLPTPTSIKVTYANEFPTVNFTPVEKAKGYSLTCLNSNRLRESFNFYTQKIDLSLTNISGKANCSLSAFTADQKSDDSDIFEILIPNTASLSSFSNSAFQGKATLGNIIFGDKAIHLHYPLLDGYDNTFLFNRASDPTLGYLLESTSNSFALRTFANMVQTKYNSCPAKFSSASKGYATLSVPTTCIPKDSYLSITIIYSNAKEQLYLTSKENYYVLAYNK